MAIHPTAIIGDGADIHELAEIGPYSVIGPNVKIGSGTIIGPHVVVDGHTEIGADCNIYAGATIGLDPQDRGYKGEPTGVKIGDRVHIREYATIHRATGEGFTTIGDDCFLMNYAHVAHNCKVGKAVTMANSATLAGHVHVGDYTVMAGFVVVHQHVQIGRLCMFSGMTGTRVDIPPFATLDGRPSMFRGINRVGLKRVNVSQEVRTAIKETYRLVYREGLNATQALTRIEQEIELYPEVKEIVDFIKGSKRGICQALQDEEEGDSDGGKKTTATRERGVLSAGAAGGL
ncbi:MAG: acyl-ACP--UDP-N-acetylglucosamine O-acyltransferase [Cyanobacteria bacterium HKST-UBA02]|nr:acyl-ACP--UDP-N-acetylglucosamine O-acyltransferase [Cyanobacteria bacterium HKST-UBA02]